MKRGLLVLILALLPWQLRADTFPTQERGFQAEKAFHVGDFDTVNLFNGNLVLTIPIGGSYPVGGGLSYGLTLIYNSNVWDYEQTASSTTQAFPSRRSNAGMGWRLSLGQLLEPTDPSNETTRWLYVGSDGAEHSFHASLHEGEVGTGADYTRDNSYLRFRSISSTEKKVDFPDGTIQTFTRFSPWDWRLTRIEDRFDNFVDVSYVEELDTGEVTAWKIEDKHGRIQTINFVTADWYNRVVGSVVLTGFGSKSTWSFGYTEATIPRPCPDNDGITDTVTVPLLTSVSLPDGSSWSMPLSDHHLDQSAGCRLPGVLKAVTTPVLGRVEWVYGGYGFPVETDEKPWRNFAHGVYNRTLKSADGAIQGTWAYTPSLNPIPGPLTPGREAMRVVVSPLGDKTESFFSVSVDETGGWSQFDYSLPFTRFVTDGGTRFLSTRSYDCDAGATNCVLKRSSYVAYERDAGPFNGEFQINMDRNRRVSSTRTIHDDDGGKWEAADHSNFDGLGHYRQTALSGNFDSGNSATSITNYNPTRGTYPGSFVMLGSSEAWVLGTYDAQTRTESGVTAKTEHCFDTATGALLRTRILKTGASRGINDVVSAFTYTSGNVTKEEHYGGDVQALLTGELCGLALPANQYRIDHGWQYGVRNSSQYFNAAGAALSFKSLNTVIDIDTGLVEASRDTSLIQTDYEYDALGRLVWVKPETGHDGWTQYVYSRALDASTPAQVQILRKSNGGSTLLADSLVKYDSFGRVWQEHTRMPDGTLSIRQTNYNAMHWKTAVSEQGNTAETTQYLNHDPFGRPRTIRPPDGSAHDVTLVYIGVRQMSRTSKVGNSFTGGTVNEVLSTTQEIYDRQGRLYQVKEQAEADSTNTTTTYTYDVGNRLSRVQQATTAETQNRWFTYDNRGFLTSEQHPEKGAAGNGTVSYSNYDARGHAQNKSDGPHNLTFTYDRAERLTQVTGNGGQLLKTFAYGISEAVGSRTNGRLETATRYNYVGSPFDATAAITETYVYGGRQGRASKRTTQLIFNGTPSESFAQSWSWNALGDLGNINYPTKCALAGCEPVSRTVSPGYTNGFLTSVPGWATAISYHPNGMLNQITHTNAIVDTQANDPDMMRRPSSISAAKSGVTLWSSGAYKYDGSGNVVKTGNGYFLYDRVSRLVEGRVQDGPTGGGTQKWQSYTYDPFGNIQAIGGTSGRSTPTTSPTNRLTGGTFDSAGNLINWNTNAYEYDRFNQMTRMVSGAEDWRYIYTAGDERFWSYRVNGGGSLWALRDLDGRLLREYEAHVSWSTFKDYIYRGTQLLGSDHPTGGARHFHLDHLGTPRLVTTAGTGGDFFTLTPCRVLDTRNQATPLTAGETRVVTMAGTCGIPSGASGVAVNITVVDATAQGEMTAYPANEPRPTASAISYYAVIARSNNGILKLGNGALAFFANQPSGSAHLIVDVTGYFTEGAGAVVAYHAYYPFGEEATAFNQDTEQMKFTGHERDLASATGSGDDLDYMHARHCSPLTGRFLSVDPAMQSADPFIPQSWNRYAYVLGNPMAFKDPSGATWILVGAPELLQKFQSLANAGLHGQNLAIDKDGTATLVSNGIEGPPTPEQAAFAELIQGVSDQTQIVRQTLSSGSATRIGSYPTGDMDVLDLSNLSAIPTEPDSAVGSIAHELAEQNAKQTALSNGQLRDALFGPTHEKGIGAHHRVTGWKTLSSDGSVETYQRGSVQRTIGHVFENGNLVRRIE